MRIEQGTCRLVLVDEGGGVVYKLPLSELGKRANEQEYNNYLNSPDIVALTEKYYWGLKQELLYNTKIFPYDVKSEELSDELKPLLEKKLNNRFQVGQDKNGNWKYFDYEDVKFSRRKLT